MRSLIYTVFSVYIVTILFYFLKVPFIVQAVMMLLLGVGIILAKFTYDYYENRKLHESYLKYAIYSGLAFLIYTGAMFSLNRLPPEARHFTYVLYLMSLLIFSMIGVHDSLKAMKSAREKDKKQKGVFYLSLFAIHGLYAFILASAFLKGYNMNFLLPAILIVDLVVLLPFIIIKKAYNQYLVLALFVISLSINSYLFLMLFNSPK